MRHESQKILAFYALLKNLEPHISLICNSSYQRGIFYLDRNFSDWLLSNFSPCVACPLFIKIKSSFINKYYFKFSPCLCFMIRQESLKSFISFHFIGLGVRFDFYTLNSFPSIIGVSFKSLIATMLGNFNIIVSKMIY